MILSITTIYKKNIRNHFEVLNFIDRELEEPRNEIKEVKEGCEKRDCQRSRIRERNPKQTRTTASLSNDNEGTEMIHS